MWVFVPLQKLDNYLLGVWNVHLWIRACRKLSEAERLLTQALHIICFFWSGSFESAIYHTNLLHDMYNESENSKNLSQSSSKLRQELRRNSTTIFWVFEMYISESELAGNSLRQKGSWPRLYTSFAFSDLEVSNLLYIILICYMTCTMSRKIQRIWVKARLSSDRSERETQKSRTRRWGSLA